MLVVELQIGFRDGIGIQHLVRPIIQPVLPALPVLPVRGDAAINDEMADMDVLRVKLARQRLR